MIEEHRRTDANGMPTHHPRQWSAVAGAAIGFLGAAFVAGVLVQHRAEVARAFSRADSVLLVVSLVPAALGMTGIGLVWRRSVQVLGGTIALGSALRGYFVGQLGKYLPGGVWAIMGRGEWARSEGIPGPVAYSSVVLSMGSAYLSALLLVALLVPLSGLLDPGRGGEYLFVLVLVPVGFVLIHPRVMGETLKRMRRMTRRELSLKVPSWRASIGVVLRQLPSWLLIGATSVIIATAYGTKGDAVNIIAATAVAWVIGFITLPVPGGIGVREAAFVALASSLPAGVAAAVALTARLVFVVVDAGGAAVASALYRRRRETA